MSAVTDTGTRPSAIKPQVNGYATAALREKDAGKGEPKKGALPASFSHIVALNNELLLLINKNAGHRGAAGQDIDLRRGLGERLICRRRRMRSSIPLHKGIHIVIGLRC